MTTSEGLADAVPAMAAGRRWTTWNSAPTTAVSLKSPVWFLIKILHYNFFITPIKWKWNDFPLPLQLNIDDRWNIVMYTLCIICVINYLLAELWTSPWFVQSFVDSVFHDFLFETQGRNYDWWMWGHDNVELIIFRDDGDDEVLLWISIRSRVTLRTATQSEPVSAGVPTSAFSPSVLIATIVAFCLRAAQTGGDKEHWSNGALFSRLWPRPLWLPHQPESELNLWSTGSCSSGRGRTVEPLGKDVRPGGGGTESGVLRGDFRK